MIRRPPRSTQSRSSAASDVYKRQYLLRMLRMARVGDGVQEDGVAGGAFYSLRRACTGAGDAARVEDALHGILDRVDDNVVTPVVAEVVGVEQQAVAVGERVRQREVLLVLDLRAVPVVQPVSYTHLRA